MTKPILNKLFDLIAEKDNLINERLFKERLMRFRFNKKKSNAFYNDLKKMGVIQEKKGLNKKKVLFLQ